MKIKTNKRVAKDFSDAKSMLNKQELQESASKLNAVHDRAEMSGRPLNHMEQSALQTLFAIGEFIDVCKPIMSRRTKNIKGAAMRLGQIQYAARTLFEDIISGLDVVSADRFLRNAKAMRLMCKPIGITKDAPWETVINDEDLFQIAKAAWSGVCEMCDKTGVESRKCPLKKAFDHTMVLDPGDGESGCIWKE